MSLIIDAFLSPKTVSLLIATGDTPILAIGNIERFCGHHHDDDRPIEMKSRSSIALSVKGKIREEENYILFTLTQALNGFPVNTKFLINVDNIIAIGPVPTPEPVLGLVTPLINDASLDIGSLAGKTAIVMASILDDTTEGYYANLHPTPKTITFTTGSAAAFAGHCSELITMAPKPVSPAANYLQIAKDMEMRRLEEMIITQKWLMLSSFAAPPPPVVGEQADMYIDHGNGNTLTTVTCVYISAMGNYWVDNNYLSDPVLTLTAIKNLANFWDNTAYPTDTLTFGMPTDTDGDPRINIVFSPLERIPGDGYVGGYFSPKDQFPRNADNPYSNERDMFYLTIPLNTYELSLFNGYLAHEFQHMINFDQHLKIGVFEIVWLNEAMSELADCLCTNDAQNGRDVSDFLANPISLTIWCANGTAGGEPWDVLLNYSAVRLFALYLYDRFVSTGIKPNLLKDIDSGVYGLGMKNVTAVSGIPFDQLFQDWMAALYLSNRGITSDPIYNFTSINLQLPPYAGIQLGTPLNVGATGTSNVYPYAITAFPLNGITGTSKITLSGATAGGLIIGY
jgi:hypothetical protein